MPPRQHVRVMRASAVPYWSSSCRIGTHDKCAHASAAPAEVGMPVVYEACACPCHPPVTPDTSGEATS